MARFCRCDASKLCRGRCRIILLAAFAPFTFAGCGGCGGATAGTGTTGQQFAKVINLGSNSQSAINDSGLMAGAIDIGSSNFPPFFADTWQVGAPQAAALPGPGEQGAQNGTNTSAACFGPQGIIGGDEENPTTLAASAAIWNNSSFQTLAVPSSFNSDSFRVTAINSSLQMVGTEAPPALGVSSNLINGFYWASPTAVGVGFPLSFRPTAISNSGIVVGLEANEAQTQVSLFKVNINQSTTALTELGQTPIATSGSGNITEDSDGNIYLSNGSSFDLLEISSSGKQTQLGTGAIPRACNLKGDVVGSNTKGHAFIYTPSKGVVDMNSYLSPSAGLVLEEAYAINDNGQVLCFAQPSGSNSILDDVVVELPPGDF